MLPLEDVQKAVGLDEGEWAGPGYVEVGVNPGQLPIAITLFVDGLGWAQAAPPTGASCGPQTCFVELGGVRLALVEQTKPSSGVVPYLFLEAKDPGKVAATIVNWAKWLGDEAARANESLDGLWRVGWPSVLCCYLAFIPYECESS